MGCSDIPVSTYTPAHDLAKMKEERKDREKQKEISIFATEHRYGA
jgi:hypothetical protein